MSRCRCVCRGDRALAESTARCHRAGVGPAQMCQARQEALRAGDGQLRRDSQAEHQEVQQLHLDNRLKERQRRGSGRQRRCANDDSVRGWGLPLICGVTPTAATLSLVSVCVCLCLCVSSNVAIYQCDFGVLSVRSVDIMPSSSRRGASIGSCWIYLIND